MNNIRLRTLIGFIILTVSYLSIGTVQAAGTFSLMPSSGNYLRSCNQSVDVVINVTSDQSNAADIILTYDTSKIDIVDALPSIPGIQILPGNAFESYAGNSVNTLTGEIKLVGYSSSSTLTGAATFASILFKSKPLASTGGFNFTFTGANPYNTLDSNIADSATSFDMLSSVSNASYTFVSGSCATDTTPPTITFISPANLANNVPPTNPVIVKLADSGSGIAITTMQVVINGTIYTSTSPGVTISGTPTNYTVTILPTSPFPTNTVSVISATVSDTAGNTKNANISVNNAYSCPITYVTKPGTCPSIPSETKDRESPTVTIRSSTSLNIRQPYKLVINITDNDGIAQDSFSLFVANKTFTPIATPGRISITGGKTNSTFEITLTPDELATVTEGKLIGTIRITDLVGNTRIENLAFTVTGIPTNGPAITSTKNIYSTIANLLTYYVAPLVTFVYLLFFTILGTQPVIAVVTNRGQKPVRFPRGYIVFQDGTRQKLYGTFNGKLHGRLPHETVKLVIQKYGHNSITTQLHPKVKHEIEKITLPQL